MTITRPLVVVVALASCACSVEERLGSDASSDELSTSSFVSARDYWKTSSDQDAWFATTHKLESEFDNICGDTFCGGDYSNLTSLGFDCSVTSARGAVRECVWTFVGSSHLVNGGTGTVTASVATFQCRVAPKTSARALLKTLGATGAAGDDALHRALPGSTQSLYDVLGDCFQHPLGASPTTSGTGQTYLDAIDSYDAGTDVGAFFAAGDALRSGFDQVCADTVCEGDYTNLQALRLACSVRGTTGTLRSCKWFFGGSYNDIDPKSGKITVNAKTYQCALPVKGTANELSTVLNGPSESGTAPIDRPLPGSSKSAYDVISECL